MTKLTIVPNKNAFHHAENLKIYAITNENNTITIKTYLNCKRFCKKYFFPVINKRRSMKTTPEPKADEIPDFISTSSLVF